MSRLLLAALSTALVGSPALAAASHNSDDATPQKPLLIAKTKKKDQKDQKDPKDEKKEDKKDNKKDDKKDGKKNDDTDGSKVDATTGANAGSTGTENPTGTNPADPTLPPPVSNDKPAVTKDDIEKLREEIRSEMRAQLKDELQTSIKDELRQEIKQELDAAEAARQQNARELETESWSASVKPRLNFLEFGGYFRTRMDYYGRLDLGTFDPVLGVGTSGFPVPTMYRPYDGEAGCAENGTPDVAPGQICQAVKEDTNSMLSMNMRLRLDPTLHVSEDIRIRSTVDVMDNVVLGANPESLPGFANNPTLPLPLFASSQNPTQEGLNWFQDAIRVKRLWAEVMTPFGQLRFGRQPQNFGLGLLANDGNKIDNDAGDNADMVLFATKLFDHYVVPAYSISSAGPVGRGGGSGIGGDAGFAAYPGEAGQRINLDPSDDVHTFILTVAKRDTDDKIADSVSRGEMVLNYGLFSFYRTQKFDIPAYYANLDPTKNPIANSQEYVIRNAQAVGGSLWGKLLWDKLRIEAEFAGVTGTVQGTSVSSNGLNSVDEDLQVLENGQAINKPLFILQGGAAIESSYRLLNDSLVIGLDAGIASGDDAPGFGLRPVINQQPQAGSFDGKQYGACLQRDADGNCLRVDNDITNFRFDSDYIVDLILFREILGTVTDAAYIKPHVAYYVNESVGVRLDVIYSNALFASSTPGFSGPLGIEADVTAFYGSDDGFYTMLQYGFFQPFGAFNHGVNPENNQRFFQVDDRFANAQFAQTLQLMMGVQF